jgi:hypothetical protein
MYQMPVQNLIVLNFKSSNFKLMLAALVVALLVSLVLYLYLSGNAGHAQPLVVGRDEINCGRACIAVGDY